MGTPDSADFIMWFSESKNVPGSWSALTNQLCILAVTGAVSESRNTDIKDTQSLFSQNLSSCRLNTLKP